MAPNGTSVDDFTFIMTCLKHSTDKPKVNFDEVAKEIGAKSGHACYHKHWGIMKKWGLAGNSGTGRKAGAPAATKPATPRKRKPKNEADADANEGPDDELATPSKKAKPTPKKTAAPIVKDEDSDSEDGGVRLDAGDADKADGN